MKFTLAAVLAVLALAACNTVQGVGRDLQAIGDALTGTSEEAQGKDAELAGGPGSRRN